MVKPVRYHQRTMARLLLHLLAFGCCLARPVAAYGQQQEPDISISWLVGRPEDLLQFSAAVGPVRPLSMAEWKELLNGLERGNNRATLRSVELRTTDLGPIWTGTGKLSVFCPRAGATLVLPSRPELCLHDLNIEGRNLPLLTTRTGQLVTVLPQVGSVDVQFTWHLAVQPLPDGTRARWPWNVPLVAWHFPEKARQLRSSHAGHGVYQPSQNCWVYFFSQAGPVEVDVIEASSWQHCLGRPAVEVGETVVVSPARALLRAMVTVSPPAARGNVPNLVVRVPEGFRLQAWQASDRNAQLSQTGDQMEVAFLRPSEKPTLIELEGAFPLTGGASARIPALLFEGAAVRYRSSTIELSSGTGLWWDPAGSAVPSLQTPSSKAGTSFRVPWGSQGTPITFGTAAARALPQCQPSVEMTIGSDVRVRIRGQWDPSPEPLSELTLRLPQGWKIENVYSPDETPIRAWTVLPRSDSHQELVVWLDAPLSKGSQASVEATATLTRSGLLGDVFPLPLVEPKYSLWDRGQLTILLSSNVDVEIRDALGLESLDRGPTPQKPHTSQATAPVPRFRLQYVPGSAAFVRCRPKPHQPRLSVTTTVTLGREFAEARYDFQLLDPLPGGPWEWKVFWSELPSQSITWDTPGGVRVVRQEGDFTTFRLVGGSSTPAEPKFSATWRIPLRDGRAVPFPRVEGANLAEGRIRVRAQAGSPWRLESHALSRVAVEGSSLESEQKDGRVNLGEYRYTPGAQDPLPRLIVRRLDTAPGAPAAFVGRMNLSVELGGWKPRLEVATDGYALEPTEVVLRVPRQLRVLRCQWNGRDLCASELAAPLALSPGWWRCRLEAELTRSDSWPSFLIRVPVPQLFIHDAPVELTQPILMRLEGPPGYVPLPLSRSLQPTPSLRLEEEPMDLVPRVRDLIVSLRLFRSNTGGPPTSDRVMLRRLAEDPSFSAKLDGITSWGQLFAQIGRRLDKPVVVDSFALASIGLTARKPVRVPGATEASDTADLLETAGLELYQDEQIVFVTTANARLGRTLGLSSLFSRSIRPDLSRGLRQALHLAATDGTSSDGRFQTLEVWWASESEESRFPPVESPWQQLPRPFTVCDYFLVSDSVNELRLLYIPSFLLITAVAVVGLVLGWIHFRCSQRGKVGLILSAGMAGTLYAISFVLPDPFRHSVGWIAIAAWGGGFAGAWRRSRHLGRRTQDQLPSTVPAQPRPPVPSAPVPLTFLVAGFWAGSLAWAQEQRDTTAPAVGSRLRLHVLQLLNEPDRLFVPEQALRELQQRLGQLENTTLFEDASLRLDLLGSTAVAQIRVGVQNGTLSVVACPLPAVGWLYESVRLDGESIAVRWENGVLHVPVPPGKHQLEVRARAEAVSGPSRAMALRLPWIPAPRTDITLSVPEHLTPVVWPPLRASQLESGPNGTRQIKGHVGPVNEMRVSWNGAPGDSDGRPSRFVYDQLYSLGPDSLRTVLKILPSPGSVRERGALRFELDADWNLVQASTDVWKKSNGSVTLWEAIPPAEGDSPLRLEFERRLSSAELNLSLSPPRGRPPCQLLARRVVLIADTWSRDLTVGISESLKVVQTGNLVAEFPELATVTTGNVPIYLGWWDVSNGLYRIDVQGKSPVRKTRTELHVELFFRRERVDVRQRLIAMESASELWYLPLRLGKGLRLAALRTPPEWTWQQSHDGQFVFLKGPRVAEKTPSGEINLSGYGDTRLLRQAGLHDLVAWPMGVDVSHVEVRVSAAPGLRVSAEGQGWTRLQSEGPTQRFPGQEPTLPSTYLSARESARSLIFRWTEEPVLPAWTAFTRVTACDRLLEGTTEIRWPGFHEAGSVWHIALPASVRVRAVEAVEVPARVSPFVARDPEQAATLTLQATAPSGLTILLQWACPPQAEAGRFPFPRIRINGSAPREHRVTFDELRVAPGCDVQVEGIQGAKGPTHPAGTTNSGLVVGDAWVKVVPRATSQATVLYAERLSQFRAGDDSFDRFDLILWAPQGVSLELKGLREGTHLVAECNQGPLAPLTSHRGTLLQLPAMDRPQHLRLRCRYSRPPEQLPLALRVGLDAVEQDVPYVWMRPVGLPRISGASSLSWLQIERRRLESLVRLVRSLTPTAPSGIGLSGGASLEYAACYAELAAAVRVAQRQIKAFSDLAFARADAEVMQDFQAFQKTLQEAEVLLSQRRRLPAQVEESAASPAGTAFPRLPAPWALQKQGFEFLWIEPTAWERTPAVNLGAVEVREGSEGFRSGGELGWGFLAAAGSLLLLGWPTRGAGLRLMLGIVAAGGLAALHHTEAGLGLFLLGLLAGLSLILFGAWCRWWPKNEGSFVIDQGTGRDI